MNTTSTIPKLLPIERPLVVFDLETTGLSIGDDKMIELAYRKIMPDGGVTAVTYRLNPGMPIPEDATAIHGITDEAVADAPSFAQLCYELWSVFDGADVGGFNITGFDLPFLKAEFAKVGKNFDYTNKRVLDAKVLYHKMVPRDMVSARNLSAAYKFYCHKEHMTAHTGAGDVEVTVEILEKQLQEHPEFRDWDFITELHGRKKLLDSVKNEHSPLVPKKAPNSLF